MKNIAKQTGIIALLSMLIDLIFTGIDYLFHIIIPNLEVPSGYFLGKIIATSIILFIIFFVIKFMHWKLKNFKQALFIAFIVCLILEIRYIFVYQFSWIKNIILISLHTLILSSLLFIYIKIKERL